MSSAREPDGAAARIATGVGAALLLSVVMIAAAVGGLASMLGGKVQTCALQQSIVTPPNRCRDWTTRLWLEAVAHAWFGHEVPGAAGIGFEFAA